MLPLFVIPVIIWGVTPDRWHPILLIVTVVTFVGYLGISFGTPLVYAARDRQRQQLGDYRWRKDWPAHSFQSQLDIYLRLHGWRILESSTIGVNCITIVAEKDRCRAAMLCVRPNHLATQAELEQLAFVARSTSASSIVMISHARRGTPASAACSPVMLRFSDVPKLDDALGII